MLSWYIFNDLEGPVNEGVTNPSPSGLIEITCTVKDIV